MKCFLLCAGLGTRMLDLTRHTPKPLLRIQGKSLLEINLQFAYSNGIRDFYLNTHYLPEQIEEEVSKFPGFNIHISKEEKEILGTAGGIKTALDQKISEEETFLVINPDSIFYPSPRFKMPLESDSELLLYLTPSDPKSKNTELLLDQGKVYFEKGGYYYIGMCLMKLKVLKSVEVGKYSDLTQVFRDYSQNEKLQGKLFPGHVLDLGDKEKYLSHLDTNLPDYVMPIFQP